MFYSTIWSEALMIIGIYEYHVVFMNTYTFSWNLRKLRLRRRFHEKNFKVILVVATVLYTLFVSESQSWSKT
jgi:hypothetical protein